MFGYIAAYSIKRKLPFYIALATFCLISRIVFKKSELLLRKRFSEFAEDKLYIPAIICSATACITVGGKSLKRFKHLRISSCVLS
ncbi:hypothetical protein F4703DRAFT_1309594 [Phycomyces blakesleeanus]